jgi:hypothetical protein
MLQSIMADGSVKCATGRPVVMNGGVSHGRQAHWQAVVTNELQRLTLRVVYDVQFVTWNTAAPIRWE